MPFAIIRYAEMTSVRDRLVRARAHGTPVDDLPPGFTLEQAVARIEENIAEEDCYVFTVEDGLLVRNPAESAPEPEMSLARTKIDETAVTPAPDAADGAAEARQHG